MNDNLGAIESLRSTKAFHWETTRQLRLSIRLILHRSWAVCLLVYYYSSHPSLKIAKLRNAKFPSLESPSSGNWWVLSRSCGAIVKSSLDFSCIVVRIPSTVIIYTKLMESLITSSSEVYMKMWFVLQIAIIRCKSSPAVNWNIARAIYDAKNYSPRDRITSRNIFPGRGLASPPAFLHRLENKLHFFFLRWSLLL